MLTPNFLIILFRVVKGEGVENELFLHSEEDGKYQMGSYGLEQILVWRHIQMKEIN